MTPSLSQLLTLLPTFAGALVVEHLALQDGSVHVRARTAGSAAPCPSCKTFSSRSHGSYGRRLADLAWQGLPVRLAVRVRRFLCLASACPRRTFTESLPSVAAPRARRTQRMADAVTRVGLAVGGEAGARLLPTLGADVSADTVLRHVRRAPTRAVTAPRVLGVDEWALRRGHTYGTVLVDLERREPVGLLPDRSADSFAAWLTAHPGVEVITRDRSEIYAEGARRGAPQAVQVADRWHLFKNVGDALERVLHQQRAALAEAAKESVEAANDRRGPTEEIAARREPTPAQTARPGLPRQTWYDEIHRLHREGVSQHVISARMGLSRVTIRKYLRAPTCPTRAPRRTKIGTLTGFDTHLRTRWEAGCRDAVVLWQELRAQGFRGTYRTVQRHVAGWRTIEDVPTAIRAAMSAQAPSPRQARWWLTLPSERLSASQRRFVEVLVRNSDRVRSAQRLAVTFDRVLRGHNAAALDAWVIEAEASEVAEFRAFAETLRHDVQAVRGAITSPWSNGQTEGQVNKIKMLKRQMYGRASVDLLRQRLLAA